MIDIRMPPPFAPFSSNGNGIYMETFQDKVRIKTDVFKFVFKFELVIMNIVYSEVIAQRALIVQHLCLETLYKIIYRQICQNTVHQISDPHLETSSNADNIFTLEHL